MTTGKRYTFLVLLGAAVLLAAVIAWRMLVLPGPLSFAGGTQVELASYPGPSPIGVPAELAGADDLTKGKYLTEAADCMACHTAKGGTPYAGGRAFRLPFGVLYAPNITSDRTTGIGAWSDAEFLRAMHKGISRDGTRLYPAFPYASYALIADGDVRLIRRYLATIPPVRQTNIPNTFSFPYNQRWLMGIWSAFFVPSQPFRPVRERSAAWNRGAYLVEGAAHCGECHTPRTLAQAMDTRQKFAGGVAEDWNAYNITSDRESGIGEWSPAELATYLKQGYARGHGVASGPMEEAVDLSLSRLTDSDIAAMVTYLRTIPPRRSSEFAAMAKPAPRSPVEGPPPGAPGARIFADACASCHAWNGSGALVGEAQLTGNRAVNDRTAANAALMVLNGMGRPDQIRRYMPGFRDSYSDAEIAAVVNYVTARYGGTPSKLTSARVAALRAK
jgi:mono/diheme cytochrome c family protein